MGDDAGLDVLDEGCVNRSQGAGCQGQIFKSHLRQLVDDLVDDVVAVAEMMVEADGVAVLQSGELDGFFQAVYDFVLMLELLRERRSIALLRRFKLSVAGDLADVGDLCKIKTLFCHLKSPPLLLRPPVR